RRNTGAFYTPPAVIRHIVDLALDAALPGSALQDALAQAREGRVADPQSAEALRCALTNLRVLDPACGTGAFLVHAMTELSRLLGAAQDARAEHVRRRDVLAQGIFGVDVNPTAVWLCELRLWLSVVVDSPERDPRLVPPLPNLDRHIRCADALAGPAFDVQSGNDEGITRLRQRYARATGSRKRSLQRALDRAERHLAIGALETRLRRLADVRRDLVCALRGRDLFSRRRVATATERAALAEWRRDANSLRRALAALRAGGAVPFGFASHFGDVAGRGGFDLVIGNPPWVRLHRIPPSERDALRARYLSMREAVWRAGAAASGALSGFGMQADLAALFAERATTLARPGGVAALLIPVKLLRSLAGGGLRGLLARSTEISALEDHSAGRSMFDAATYPAVLVARRVGAAARRAIAAPASSCAVVRRDTAIRWPSPIQRLSLDDTEGAPWLLLPPAVRAAFDLVAASGIPLSETLFGRPMLGVKTGCNDAFLVNVDPDWKSRAIGGTCIVRQGEREALIERAILRPSLRGEDLRAFASSPSAQALLWTHDDQLEPLRTLPRRAAQWLSPWRPTLERRVDAKARDRWWMLFRTEAAQPAWRVVWGDVGRTPRAVVLTPDNDTVPLNTCYFVRAPTEADADALAVWLNAPLATAWLGAIAEPARGGYHRFLGWTMARLPLPSDWSAARAILAPIGRAARHGVPVTVDELHAASLRVLDLRAVAVEPLLTWMHS
ncbi:MAG: N-6 DNA methylase, partial [Gemmatimonadetes bacterium]|nr:N-6 DNA methylase [Gemmatimonadota bacterium]